MFLIIQICLLLSLLVLMHAPTCRLQHAYKFRYFYIKTIRCSCLLGDEYKFNANVRDKDHKITKIHHFVA